MPVSKNRSTTCGFCWFCRKVCDGLSRALHDLWLRLCEVSAAALGDDKLRLEVTFHGEELKNRSPVFLTT